jgi:hypothetical protein
MPSDPSSPSKSPFLAAIGISLAIAAGSIISTLDMATVEDVATGRILTRPLAEAQQRHTLAIATLENTVGAITRDIDFVASRASATVHHSEEAASDRRDAEIAALKDKIAGIQHARLAPVRVRRVERGIDRLRSSLNDLSRPQRCGAAITRRLMHRGAGRAHHRCGLVGVRCVGVADAALLAKKQAPERGRRGAEWPHFT